MQLTLEHPTVLQHDEHDPAVEVLVVPREDDMVGNGEADLLVAVVGGAAAGGVTYVALRGLHVVDGIARVDANSSVASGEQDRLGPRRLTRVPALDGIRGVAILLVLLVHTEVDFISSWVRFHHNYGLLDGGSLGVDVFFVLSGFLITALLLRDETDRGHVNLGSFYRNRALRLLPAVVVMLAGTLLFRWLIGESMRGQLESAAFGLFYLANWQSTWNHHEALNFGHLWSLSVEEQFYFVWPTVLIVFFGLRRNVRMVTAGLVAVIAAIAIRRGLLWGAGYNWVLLYEHTDTRADSLLIGALLACLWVRRLTPTRALNAAGWIASGVLLACVAFTRTATAGYFPPSNGFLYQGGFVVVAVACAVIILATVDGRWAGTRILELRPLRALGRVSYGLYLWHQPVFIEVAVHTSGWAVLPRVALAWAIAFTLTIASWKIVEQPFLRLKNRPAGRDDDQPDTSSPRVVPLPREDDGRHDTIFRS